MVRDLAVAGQTVVSAGCGREHTLVAVSSGAVFAWGWGEGGRLGLGEVGAVPTPRRVEEVRSVDLISGDSTSPSGIWYFVVFSAVEVYSVMKAIIYSCYSYLYPVYSFQALRSARKRVCDVS